MAIGFVEMQGQITRAQDFTAIKHNDDTKSMVQQANFGQQMTKQIEKQVKRVNEGKQYHERKFDAKDKGSNEYRGDGGKSRRDKREQEQEPDGKVIMKKLDIRL